MSPQHILSESVLACKDLTERYLSGFNSMNHTRQSEHLPNHVAWILGHCAYTLHLVAGRLDGASPPETDFSDTPCVSATDDPTFCFHNESIAYGSEPVDDPSIYPSYERCFQIFETACERLARAVAGASQQDLLRTTTWGRTELPMHLLISRMVFHTGVHTGQIADLRRAMGMSLVMT